jgi:ribosomal protein S18 acetylase RimI-like enzyme
VERWTVQLEVSVRPCLRSDLRGLEWYGVFRAHHRRFAAELARQRRGEALILVALVQGSPIGQVFIDLSQARSREVGVLWALRVMPHLQRLGIGTRLISAAERGLAARGLSTAELCVEKWNDAALRLYERLDYARAGELRVTAHRLDSTGRHRSEEVDVWVLRKALRAGVPVAEGGWW